MALQLRATPLRRLVQRERLVIQYWYLCRRAARRFERRGLERGDLEQIGAIGLLKAADRYDSSQRAPFAAYAWLLINGELMHYARDGERIVRVPRTIRRLDRRWTAAERELQSRLSRAPSETEVADHLGATAAQAAEVRAFRASKNVVSFELLAGLEGGFARLGIESLVDRLTLEQLLATLGPLERQIVVALDLDGMTVSELAARLGYSRRHVSRLHRNAMERLKSASRVWPRQGGEGQSDVPVSHRRRVPRASAGRDRRRHSGTLATGR